MFNYYFKTVISHHAMRATLFTGTNNVIPTVAIGKCSFVKSVNIHYYKMHIWTTSHMQMGVLLIKMHH